MNIFKYRVYQGEHCGPSKEDPFATKPLPPDRVQDCLDKLCAILPDYFRTIARDNSLFVSATICDSEQDPDAARERCVVQLNLTTTGLLLVIDRLPESHC